MSNTGLLIEIAVALLLVVALGIVTWQRDKAQRERDTYRAALFRADPEEARRLSVALQVGLQ